MAIEVFHQSSENFIFGVFMWKSEGVIQGIQNGIPQSVNLQCTQKSGAIAAGDG